MHIYSRIILFWLCLKLQITCEDPLFSLKRNRIHKSWHFFEVSIEICTRMIRETMVLTSLRPLEINQLRLRFLKTRKFKEFSLRERFFIYTKVILHLSFSKDYRPHFCLHSFLYLCNRLKILKMLKNPFLIKKKKTYQSSTWFTRLKYSTPNKNICSSRFICFSLELIKKKH